MLAEGHTTAEVARALEVYEHTACSPRSTRLRAWPKWVAIACSAMLLLALNDRLRRRLGLP